MNEKEKYPLHQLFICIFVLISIFLITFRILFNFFYFPELIKISKDYDYRLLLKGMDNGLIHFYDPIDNYDWPPYYLYFWFFLFFPMYLMPFEIGVYVWDILRLVMGIYIVHEAPKIFKSELDLFIFYALSSISYALDAYYNNCNFLITFLLFLSYESLEKDRKWLSGLFFTLATFKINSLLFLPILLIIKKIELKDIKFYIIPFCVACIPYIIFPEYFMQMVANWGHSDDYVEGITGFDSIFWKALQPTHLMTISLFLLIFIENINSKKRKHQFNAFFLPILIIYYVYLTMIVFFLPFLGPNS
ncbi:MAG: glycosyltransferase 87 family protein [Candidatus Hermodarchaeota archaeon]